jgi:hypothetical protein
VPSQPIGSTRIVPAARLCDHRDRSLAIEVPDDVARLVQFRFVEALRLSVALGRNDGSFSCHEQGLDGALVAIEGLACQQDIGPHRGQKRVGACRIMGLPRCQEESQRLI